MINPSARITSGLNFRIYPYILDDCEPDTESLIVTSALICDKLEIT
jgi:hypothetical protein